MSINVKAGGSWQASTPWVNVGGTWQRVKVAWVKAAGNWKKAYEYEWSYTFPSGEFLDIDLDSLSGIDKFHNVTITIPASTSLLSASVGGYGLMTGSGYGGTLTVINNGKILGRGGNGGAGGYRLNGSDSPAPTAGENGGHAIYVETAFTMDNNGTIAGGGGAGAGGEGAYDNSGNAGAHAGGGGGGGGAPYGVGGAGRNSAGNDGYTHGSSGGTATLTASGSGGGGGNAHADGGWFQGGAHVYAGAGGNGGAWSQSGGGSGEATGGQDTASAVGGNSGSQYINYGGHTVTQV